MPSAYENAVAYGAMGAGIRITPPEGYGSVVSELGKTFVPGGYQHRDYGATLIRTADPVRSFIDSLRNHYSPRETSAIATPSQPTKTLLDIISYTSLN